MKRLILPTLVAATVLLGFVPIVWGQTFPTNGEGVTVTGGFDYKGLKWPNYVDSSGGVHDACAGLPVAASCPVVGDGGPTCCFTLPGGDFQIKLLQATCYDIYATVAVNFYTGDGGVGSASGQAVIAGGVHLVGYNKVQPILDVFTAVDGGTVCATPVN